MALLERIKTSAKVVGVFINKYSPEILVGTGIIGMGATMYLMRKASMTDAYLRNDLANALMATDDEAEKEAMVKDVKKTQRKAYIAPAVMFTASTVCILGGVGILRNKYTKVVAIASDSIMALNMYRKRIREKYGEEADNYGMYGVEREEITVKNGETGKKEKIERDIIRNTNGDLSSPFAVLFAPFDYEHRTGSKYWERDTVANETQLTVMENGWVTRYEAGEPIFLDEIYKGLGFDVEEMYRLKGDAIRKMGWWKGHEPANSDGYFTLRLTRVVNKPDPGYGEEVENVVWIVDPNVPGVIV